jgi:acetyltransferase-like isoleucine patch superfamily enzyme
MNSMNNRCMGKSLQEPPFEAVLRRVYNQFFKCSYQPRFGEKTHIYGKLKCWALDQMLPSKRRTTGKTARFKLFTKYFEQQHPLEIAIVNNAYIDVTGETVAVELVRIGKGSTFSDQTFIDRSGQRMDSRNGTIMDRSSIFSGHIRFEDYRFVEFGETITSGVKIRHHSVVVARSAATKSVTLHPTVPANPARPFDTFNSSVRT